jgi:hypothetical protein
MVEILTWTRSAASADQSLKLQCAGFHYSADARTHVSPQGTKRSALSPSSFGGAGPILAARKNATSRSEGWTEEPQLLLLDKLNFGP